MKAPKPAAPKTRTRRVTDPAAMAAVIAKGKYREHLPHFQTDGDGLLVERRNDLENTSTGEDK